MACKDCGRWRVITGDFNVGACDNLILADATLGDITVTLRAPGGCTSCAVAVVKTDAGPNQVFVEYNGGPVIHTLSAQGEAAIYQAGDGEWRPVADFSGPGGASANTVRVEITGINLTAAGVTNIWTATDDAMLQFAALICTNDDTVSAVAEGGIGVAAGEFDQIAEGAFSGLYVTGDVRKFDCAGTAPLIQAGQTVKLGVDVGATATAQEATLICIFQLV